MGFLRDLRRLNEQSKGVREAYPVSTVLSNAQQQMASASAAISAAAGDANSAVTAMQHGTAATAMVTASRQTGLFMNHAPVVELALLVTMPGGSPVPVVVQRAIQQLHLARAQIGSRLHVKVMPHDPNQLWIDWDRPA